MADMRRREFITLLGGGGHMVARGARAAAGEPPQAPDRERAEVWPALGKLGLVDRNDPTIRMAIAKLIGEHT
jgi:hypothetical protein